MKKLFDNKIFKIGYGIIKTLFVIIIIVYLSFVLVQRVSGNKSIFGYRLFVVASRSMEGVYSIGDVIAVKDYDVKNLKIDDDIAYLGKRGGLEGKFITHRIIKIDEKENGGRIFVTKGVKSAVEDPPIDESQILGKVIGIVPVITQINHIVRSQVGFFLLIFCPLVLVIMVEILQTITEIKLDKNEIKKIEKKDDKNEDKKDEKVVEEEKEVVEEKKQEEKKKNKEKKFLIKDSDDLSDKEIEDKKEEIELL